MNNTDQNVNVNNNKLRGNKKNFIRTRKRKWTGFVPKRPKVDLTPGSPVSASSSTPQSCSGRKLSIDPDTLGKTNSEGVIDDDNKNDFFIMMHFDVLASICRECVVACPECAADVVVTDEKAKRRGFAQHQVFQV